MPQLLKAADEETVGSLERAQRPERAANGELHR
jgi:hypothetical protein